MPSGAIDKQQLSPRVWVYRASAPRPIVPEGSHAFAQIDSDAFGDGTHPTTRLCAGAVDVLSRSARSVLDVGTGTGILARIARQRGATTVVAIDIDAHARETAQTNCALDQHPVQIQVETALPDARFDLIVANILQKPLQHLAPALVRLLAPGGHLLLSGLSVAETPILRVSYGSLSVSSESVSDGWAMLCLTRPGSSH